MAKLENLKIKGVQCHLGQTIDGTARQYWSVGKEGHLVAAIKDAHGVFLVGKKTILYVFQSNIVSVEYFYEDVFATEEVKTYTNPLDRVGKK